MPISVLSACVVSFSLLRIFYSLLSKSFVFLCVVFLCCVITVFPPIIIFLPLYGALALFCSGRYFSRFFAILSILCSMFLSVCGSFFLFFVSISGYSALTFFGFKLGSWTNWISLGFDQTVLSWSIDSLAVQMLVLVSSVSFFVHLYSVNYMWEDPSLLRFLSYLSLFTFFMFVIATASNFVQFFFGWEGVGLMSYLLVGFWQDRQQASKAAWKAVFVNRLGDFMLLLGIAVLYLNFKTFMFSKLFDTVYLYVFDCFSLFSSVVQPIFDSLSFHDGGVLTFFLRCDILYFLSLSLTPFIFLELALFFLFIGAVAKSAQVGLHAWLPDAMEGPTPVSALIHAATMVTAGVYLLVRCSPLFSFSFLSQYYMSFFGAVTCIYAGLVACVQTDAKKLIAYSTMSQLGYMVLGCSANNFTSSFFHLWIHGYVKALLFLSAGIIIHQLGDEQSLSRMGGFLSLQPFLFYSFAAGSLSLMAIPLLSGFFSKEPLIDSVYFIPGFGVSTFVYWAGVFGAFCTGFYSSKLILFGFVQQLSESRCSVKSLFRIASYSGTSIWIRFIFVILIFASLFAGSLVFRYGWNGAGSYINPLFSVFATFLAFIQEIREKWWLEDLWGFCVLPTLFDFYSYSVVLVPYPFFATVSGVVFSFFSFFGWLPKNFIGAFFSFFQRKVFFDKLVNIFLCRRGLINSYVTLWAALDKGTFEYFGPYGLTCFFIWGGRLTLRLHGRSLSFYIGVFVWTIAVLVSFVVFIR